MKNKYSVLLPKTDFPMKADLPKLEVKILKFWDEINVYKKMLQKRQDSPKFILHDGPPYANGPIHIGHALNKILKDIIVKYKFLSGWNSPFIPGWDCHGLPIEQQLMKELSLTKKNTNILNFRKDARSYAEKFIKIQKEEFIRLGCFGDWGNPYITMEPKYVSRVVKLWSYFFKNGYIYRAKKPVYWCINCETALAEAEVEYEIKKSFSIYVKFTPEAGGPDILVWTTTPWTIPGNVALAFSPQGKYAEFEIITNDDKKEILIIEENLVEKIKNELKFKHIKILNHWKIEDLLKQKFINPLTKKISIPIVADFVSLQEGTGIVHIAPGHGQEDYIIGKKYNLSVFSPVDETGRFTDEVSDTVFEIVGKTVNEANLIIIEKLKTSGNLLHFCELQHSYPHCWRCKEPVIFRATDQWFLNVDFNNLRKKILDAIPDVKWVPEFGQTRITSMIQQRPDWCLSRQRLWGSPIPVFYCKKCGEVYITDEVFEKVIENIERFSSDWWFEFKESEFLTQQCKCSCGSNEFEKEKDILDVWFDSGSSFYAVLDNPIFKDSKEIMYLEGSDQHRGWFQTSIIPSVGFKNKPPFTVVLTHGFVLDGKGQKMSKSLGNVIAPQDILQKYGAEILRLWSAMSNYQDDVRISKDILEQISEIYKKIRNTFRFMLGNLFDFNPDFILDYESLLILDKYILHKLNQLIKKLKNAYEEYQFYIIAHSINDFCNNDLSSFYFDVLKDRLYTFSKNSTERKSAQASLWQILKNLVKMVCPVLPFSSEEVWQEMRKKWDLAETIFLEDFPDEISYWSFSLELEKKFDELFKIRKEVYIKIEQSRKSKIINTGLESSVIINCDGSIFRLLKEFENILPSFFIVSEVELVQNRKFSITIQKAKGKKCARCWNYSQTVGKNPSFEDICLRCVQQINLG